MTSSISAPARMGTGAMESSRPEAAAPPRFEAIYRHYARRVYRLSLHFTGDPSAAQDIKQNVFLKVHKGLPGFQGQSELGTWIYRITCNACVDYARRQRMRWVFLGDTLQETLASPAESPEDGLVREELRRSVRKALQALPPKYRIPVLLKHLDGLSYEEIAGILNCPVGTVASRVHRGLGKLAKQLRSLERHREGRGT